MNVELAVHYALKSLPKEAVDTVLGWFFLGANVGHISSYFILTIAKRCLIYANSGSSPGLAIVSEPYVGGRRGCWRLFVERGLAADEVLHRR